MNNPSPQLTFFSESEYAVYFKHNEKNIAMVRFKENEIINLERAKEIVKYMDSMFDISKNCYTIVEGDVGSILSIRARKYFAEADTFKSYKKAIAVVIKELPQRIIYNFYISFNKPTIKHKSFNSIEKAINWLLSKGA